MHACGHDAHLAIALGTPEAVKQSAFEERSGVLPAGRDFRGQQGDGIARHRDGATRVNVGRIEGGSASNVIAEEVTIDAEVRGETTALMTYARTELERMHCTPPPSSTTVTSRRT